MSMSSVPEPGALVRISEKAAEEYAANGEELLRHVNGRMKRIPVGMLVANQVEMMLQNHHHHLQFMESYFRLNIPELLQETVLWVYSAYLSHGFSPDYFPAEITNWMDAVSTFLSPESAAEINAVYGWLLGHHDFFLEAARRDTRREHETDEGPHPLGELRNEFFQGLLEGKLSRCNTCAAGYISGPRELQEFYLGVIQPAMVDIGAMWERGELSVAREHLATAIVTRILASQHMRFFGLDKPKGKALVSAAANEYHELGARMIADLLDLDGWDVKFIGSNVPVEEAVGIIRSERPSFAGISVTMPFNLEKAAGLIRRIHDTPDISGTKILVGGRAFQLSPSLWRALGADACVNNAADIFEVANSFRQA